MKELSSQLEKLLLEQSFAELNARDRAYVLSQITEEEYEQYHAFLGCSTRSFQQFSGKANPAIKAQLLSKFQQKKPAAIPFWQPVLDLFSYKVPAWQVAFGMFLFMGSFWWGTQQNRAVDAPPAKEYVYQTDTIYKEIVKTVSSTVLADTSGRTISIKPIPVHTSTKEARDFRTQPLSDNKVFSSIDTSSNPILAGKKSLPLEESKANLFHLNASPRGRSVGEDTALMKFVVEVY